MVTRPLADLHRCPDRIARLLCEEARMYYTLLYNVLYIVLYNVVYMYYVLYIFALKHRQADMT